MSELYDIMLWVACGIAGLIMLTVIVSAILAGLGLRFVADSLRGLDRGREEDDAPSGSDFRGSYGDRRFR